jgi:hypothetical protein
VKPLREDKGRSRLLPPKPGSRCSRHAFRGASSSVWGRRSPLPLVSALSVLVCEVVEAAEDGSGQGVAGLPARPDLGAGLVVLASVGELEKLDPDVATQHYIRQVPPLQPSQTVISSETHCAPEPPNSASARSFGDPASRVHAKGHSARPYERGECGRSGRLPEWREDSGWVRPLLRCRRSTIFFWAAAISRRLPHVCPNERYAP